MESTTVKQPYKTWQLQDASSLLLLVAFIQLLQEVSDQEEFISQLPCNYLPNSTNIKIGKLKTSLRYKRRQIINTMTDLCQSNKRDQYPQSTQYESYMETVDSRADTRNQNTTIEDALDSRRHNCNFKNDFRAIQPDRKIDPVRNYGKKPSGMRKVSSLKVFKNTPFPVNSLFKRRKDDSMTSLDSANEKTLRPKEPVQGFPIISPRSQILAKERAKPEHSSRASVETLESVPENPTEVSFSEQD